MTMRWIRWLTVVASIAMLSGCAYPSFNFDSYDLRIRTATLDPRFPLLKAYQECTIDCPSCSNRCGARDPVDYTFVHFDAASSDGAPPISAELWEPPRSFTGVANLIPSYSFNPAVRVLDTIAENRMTSDFKQEVFFYRNAAVEDDHRVIVQLPHERCPVWQEAKYSERMAKLWQPVKFVVIVESKATIFVEMKAPTAECRGLRVQDVLPNVSGIPADLTAQVYRVYAVDFAKITRHWVYADLVTAPSGGAAAGKVTAQLDPVPNISMKSEVEQFMCRVHTSSTDWHIFTGMAATSNGKIAYSQRCKPVKQ
ncbi:hypothetical protein GTP81_04295 [Rugamonas sp. FT107W]|uniref:Lipoprotein n=1 Tax=Duganella vulcania TaxID=2692166 RepID=A0A845HG99_9BURK|nr:hypothetical protein [Duganella vulcania]MYN15964.1 hypothetical protein [Duganella vulcania]